MLNEKKVPVYGTPLMQVYHAERAKGASIESARNTARGDYDRKKIELDWDGYRRAEARVGDYDVVVLVEADYEASRDDHIEGEFYEDAKYRYLPWGGNRHGERRFVLSSTLTPQEATHRENNHEPSSRSARNYARDSWNVWYIDFGIAGSPPKDGTSRTPHSMMEWYWRHGYSKSDAYLKAMKMQREATKRASSDELEFYDLHLIVTRADDGAEIKDEWRGSFDVDGREPAYKEFAYIKDEATTFVSDVLREIKKELEQRNGVEQTTLF